MNNINMSIDRAGFAIITPKTPGQHLIDLNKDAVKEVYKAHGAVLFSGFPFKIKAFRDLTNSFCSHAVNNGSGGREIIDAKNNIQTVDPGTKDFPLHPELSREPWKPDICFFACEKAPVSGGQTTFCDGVELVRKLPRRVRSALFRRKLRYNVPVRSAEVSFWMKKETPTPDDLENPPEDCPFEFIEIGGIAYRSYIAPVFHRPMFHNDLAFGNFLLFSRYHHNDRSFPLFEDGTPVPDELVEPIRKVGEKLTIHRAWRLGDILMLDNTRYLHARTAIKDLRARRILTYFGYLKFAVTKPDEIQDPRWRNPRWLEHAPPGILS